MAAVALTSPNALLEHKYLYSTDSQPMINTPNHGLVLSNVITPNPVIKGNKSLLNFSVLYIFVCLSCLIDESVIVEELSVPENCCSTSSSRDKQRTRTVTETTEQGSCEKSHRGKSF